jgi:two-component system, chemotaxis family, sensor kinase CheA
MDDLLKEFLTETSESISVLDADLAEIEKNRGDTRILSNILHVVQTVGETSGFLDLPRLEKVSHHGEAVLGKFSDGIQEFTPEALALVRKVIDQIKHLLIELEETSTEPEGDDSALFAELQALAEGRTRAETAEAPAATSAPPLEPIQDDPTDSIPEKEDDLVVEELMDEAGEVTAQSTQATSDEGTALQTEAERAEERAVALTPEPERVSDGTAVTAQSIRVNVDLLDNLMTLVSELVLTRNQLLQMVRGHDDSEFTVPLQRLSHITTDLQEGVMKTRMQPIGNAWAKLPRMVRDLSAETGKKIDLRMLGADTELDRQVLELIQDPLTQMVRNSAEHDVEAPEKRAKLGKPEVGTITLNAFHEGGHIIIEISDDGSGLNIERIKAKVINNGLATESELEGMSEQQIQQFILKPGFSTAEKDSGVSGCGVGMDVVRTNVEKIGGTMEFKSVEGRGSTFTIKIPLTLAIVSALIVESASERFAIPQISVLELVRASTNDANTIEMINEAPVLRLRNRLLPLVALRDCLKLDGKLEAVTGIDEELFIVVAQVGAFSFGIIVDRVFDTEEIVVKPVAPILRQIPFFSGNTILGDGSVIMILDPNGIAAAVGEVSMGAAQAVETTQTAATVGEEKSSMLVFRAGGEELRAVPLALVARLEEIDMSMVEQAQGQSLVQYRGHLMPLIPFNPAHVWKAEGRQPILVFTDRERSMGLVVDQIVDIVEDRLKIELSADQPGLIGSAVIDGKATDIVDVGHYVTQAFSDWFGSAGQPTAKVGNEDGNRVLLVDDSPFFRNLLRPLLSVAGYHVTSAESAEEALGLREDRLFFDVIVSDIEMPEMDGFEFARAVRSDPRWENLPMVALSAHATEKDFERGREVGYDDHVAKFDRDALVQTLEQVLRSKSQARLEGAA